MIRFVEDEENFWCSLFHIKSIVMHPTNPLLVGEEIDANNHDASEESCCENLTNSGLGTLFPSSSSMNRGITKVRNN